MKYTCITCGESRFFYTEVSVKAKQRIDLKDGSRHNMVYGTTLIICLKTLSIAGNVMNRLT